MKKIFLILFILVNAAWAMEISKVSGEVKVTAKGYSNKTTEKSFFHDNDTVHTDISGSVAFYVSDHIDGLVTVSNRLGNSYVDRAWLRYVNRKDSNMVEFKIGTLEIFKGIFDRTKPVDGQAPIMYYADSVYNNTSMDGFLDTTIGAELTYKHLFKTGLLMSASVSKSKIRVTDSDKTEQTVFSYTTPLLDIEFPGSIINYTIDLNYNDKFNVYYSYLETEFRIVDTSGLSMNEKLFMYSQGKLDKIAFTPTDKPYRSKTNRYGGTVMLNDWLIGYEHDLIATSTDNVGIDDIWAEGEFIYIAKYGWDNFVPYVLVGRGKNSRHDAKWSFEKAIGTKYIFNKRISMMAEIRETDWLDTNSKTDAVELESKGPKDERDVKIFSFQVSYLF